MTNARSEDWVSLTCAPTKQVDQLQANFITDANDELPATVTVYYRNTDDDWLPVTTGNLADLGAASTVSLS